MAKYKFGPGAIVLIDGVPHRPLDDGPGLVTMHDDAGRIFKTLRVDGTEGIPTLEEFDRLVSDGRAMVRETARRTDALTVRDTAEWDAGQCSALDPASAKRLFTCRRLDEAGVPNGEKAMARALEELWTPEIATKHGPRPNAATVKRWRSERGRAGFRKQRDMVSMQGRTTGSNDRSIVRAACIEIAVARFYDGSPNSTIISAHAMCAVEIDRINRGEHHLYDAPEVPLSIPSYATVRRAIRVAENLKNTALRNGDKYASSTWLGSGNGLEAYRPLQLGIIDHSQLPCVVVDPEKEIVLGPVWLTILVDVFSRAILGWVVSFNSPSLWSVGEVLRRANRPKRPPPVMQERYHDLRTIMGRTGELILDNAKEFTGHGMEAIAGGSGMVVRHCPMRQPRFRAMGERMFGTIKRKLLDGLPNAKMPVGYSRIADYDAEHGAVTTIDDIEAALNHIVAEIHTEPSAALDGRTPLLMFEKGIRKHGIDVWWDVDSATRELQEVATGVQLSKSGIRKFGMRYFDSKLVPDLLDALIPLEPRRQRREDATVTVNIRYDPSDISVIHVWNRQTRRHVTLKCDEPTYSKGMPLWLHTEIRKAAKKEGEAFNTEMERLRARDRRIEAIKNIKPKSKKAERTQFGKLLEIPRQNQIRGNIVEVEDVEPTAVTLDDFISHDVASQSSLDIQILSPRKASSQERGEKASGRRRDGQTDTDGNNSTPRANRRSSRRIKRDDEG